MKDWCNCNTLLRCILPIMFFSLMVVPSHADIPTSGDWIVTGLETIDHQIITLNGNLIVQNGGSLTLSSVTLTMNNSYNGEYGILIKSGGALTIEKGTINTATPDSARFSFAVESGSQFLMKDSEVHGCGWGPDSEDLWDKVPILGGMRGLVIDTSDAVIENTTLSGNHIGIILTGTGITLDNNHIHSNNVHGIYIRGGSRCQITNNAIQHSSISSPFRMVEGEDNTIKGNIITLSTIHRGVIETMFSHGNVIEENDLSGLGVAVALMFVSNNNTVRGNTIAMDETGIMVWGWNNKIEGNVISDPSDRTANGIYMVYAYNSVVTENTISNVKMEGIWLRRSSNNTILNNQISASSTYDTAWSSGFLLMSSSKRNVIYGNTTSGFLRGVSVLFSSDDNMIANNGIASTKYQAIVIDDCTDNIVYGNDFGNYGRLPYDNNENLWEQDGMGNHWRDYVGTDTNGDGVGDEPFVVGPEGADNFPLMSPIAVGSLPVPEVKTASPPEYDTLFGRTVTGAEIIENQTIVLHSINVESGGSLTLRNVDLVTGASKWCSDLSVASGGSLSIYNCKISHLDNGYGFQMQPSKGSNFVMKDSEIVGCGHEMWYGGIQIYADHAVLENNLITDSMISFFNTSGGQVTGNTISGSYWAVNIEGSSDITVSNNTLYNCIERAVGAYDSNNIILTNNTISGIWGNGIGTWLSLNSQIKGNSISDMNEVCREAIGVYGTNGVANENNVSGCSFGLILGQGNTAINNSVSNCSTGIQMNRESDVEGNLIVNCETGIDLNGETNQIIGNTLWRCHSGIQGSFCRNNLIYHNNLIENVIQASAENSDNQWDNNGEGNYWSDYTGVDTDDDGIGDIPYHIELDRTDNYPLALPKGFAIDSINPKRNAEDMPVDTQIVITFAKAMNVSTISSNTFTISDGSNNIVGNISYYETTAMFSPDNDFDYGKIYTVTLTNGIEDLAGNPLLTDFVWSFTTQSGDVNGSNGDGGDSSGNSGNSGSSGSGCFIDILDIKGHS